SSGRRACRRSTHPGARRRRTADDCDVAEKHAYCGRAATGRRMSVPRMLKVALTGGIATGKSHVLEVFRRRGVPCLDADVLAHGVTAAGTEATAAIAARFGADVLAADGSV